MPPRSYGRRSLKFAASPSAHHFLCFDPSVSKLDRLVFSMKVFMAIPDLAQLTESNFRGPAYLPEELLEIRICNDPAHPAFGQAGLYAKKNIPSNTIVTSYAGFVEITLTSCSSRTYTMGFGALGDDFALDAEFAGNYGRFANDPRNTGLLPNITAESRFTQMGEPFTAMVAKRPIIAGEEILMAYGKAHQLTASPWMGVHGERLTRKRFGSQIPFPQIEMGRGSSSDGALDSVMQLFWECAQCGFWSPGSPTPVGVDLCYDCQSPRVTLSRLVASFITHPEGEPIDHTPIPAGDGNEEWVGGARQASIRILSLGVPSSEPATIDCGWPMNIPFMPWQIWDPLIPLSSISQHSKFDTQENIYLYEVALGTCRKRPRGPPHGMASVSADNVAVRVFSGKSWAKGDLIGVMGGVLRRQDDIRGPTDNTPLLFPLRYLVPTFQEGNSSRLSTAAREHLFSLKSVLEKYVLHVTNEMKHCICILLDEVRQAENSNPENREQERHREMKDASFSSRSALCSSSSSVGSESNSEPIIFSDEERCNVEVVLTNDSLGCPFVGVVALRSIAPFEEIVIGVRSS